MKDPVPYQFGISGQPLKPYDADPRKSKRLEKLLHQEHAALIVSICRHYISNFIPLPVENENEYWIISCYPSTDNSPVRVSIWFPEVFNIHAASHYYGHSDRLRCMVFVHSEYLDDPAKKDLLTRIDGLDFRPEYRFVTGIDEQLAVFMPLESYFSFVQDERIYEGIRAHNYLLTQKGRSPFKKGHNYGFVRYLLGSGDTEG